MSQFCKIAASMPGYRVRKALLKWWEELRTKATWTSSCRARSLRTAAAALSARYSSAFFIRGSSYPWHTTSWCIPKRNRWIAKVKDEELCVALIFMLKCCVQEKHAGNRRPGQSADLAWRKCQQTLQELEELLQQLEVLYSLSRVPRVLLLLGGSVNLPKELYEINMEALVVASGDRCLRVSSCLRQIFRTLFVADLLSDTRPVRLMPTTVLVLAHRNCGAEWFRPKLQFKVPTRVKKQVISLSTDSRSHKESTPDWQDYVWFQAPMTIKGFNK